MSTLTSSSSQAPDPPRPNNDGPAPGDGDNADPALWKRRYHALQESVNAQNKTKRKSGSVNLITFYNYTGLTMRNLSGIRALPVSLDAGYAK